MRKIHIKIINILNVYLDRNVRKKEYEKLKECYGLKEELEEVWKVKAKAIPMIIG